MSLADQTDVELRLGRDLIEPEIARLTGLLEEASAMVAAYLGESFAGDVPDSVVIVVSRMVARVFNAPTDSQGVSAAQFTAGPYMLQQTFSDSAGGGGPWLSKSDRLILGSPAVSVPMSSEGFRP
jgi:hypothetical protein